MRSALVIALVLGLFPGSVRAAGEFKARGFTLPGGAVRVDDDRYRLPQNWEEAQRWYRNVYPPAKYPRRTLPSQSGVKAIHIVNPRSNDEWEGVNLYELGKGEVRAFILARPGWVAPEPEAPAPKAAPPKKKAK